MRSDAVPPIHDATASRIDALTGVTEAALVIGLRRGDPVSITTLFHAYFPPLVVFVRRYVGSVDEAEELVAALFARLWERRATWAPSHTIESYLFASVRNAALNAQRAARREAAMHSAAVENASPSVLGGEARPLPDESDEDAAVIAMRAAATHALAQLPEASRVILEMRWTRQMSYEEIAEVLGSTAGAVQRQHSRVMARLRTLVDQANA